jgi:hypothetical protein
LTVGTAELKNENNKRKMRLHLSTKQHPNLKIVLFLQINNIRNIQTVLKEKYETKHGN